ncbi:hypothetical protein GW17_00043269 [Ensete ventricosum]|nr:hypothetical protein GW17_00043269 [Ensete ventricosum]
MLPHPSKSRRKHRFSVCIEVSMMWFSQPRRRKLRRCFIVAHPPPSLGVMWLQAHFRLAVSPNPHGLTFSAASAAAALPSCESKPNGAHHPNHKDRRAHVVASSITATNHASGPRDSPLSSTHAMSSRSIGGYAISHSLSGCGCTFNQL